MSAEPASQREPASERARMVEHQLRARGVRDERVLAAMRKVPREAFLPAELAPEAYADSALPIDCSQTISQPVIVAMMTAALQLRGCERVLEIGTGSGYQAAILAELAAEVYSVERHAGLSHSAEQALRRQGYQNVRLKIGDGSLGWPEEAPFDRIIITAAGETCPAPLWQQLAEGGVLVGPFGPPQEQALHEVHKVGGQSRSHVLTGCRFVPLLPGMPED